MGFSWPWGSKKTSRRLCGLNRWDHSRAQWEGRARKWKKRQAWKGTELSWKSSGAWCDLLVYNLCLSAGRWSMRLLKILALERAFDLTSGLETFLKTQKTLLKWGITQRCRARKHMGDCCSGCRPNPCSPAFLQESQEIRQNLWGLQDTLRTQLRDTDERTEVHRGKLICLRSHSKLAWELVIGPRPAPARPEYLNGVKMYWVLPMGGTDVCSCLIYSPDIPYGVIFTSISQIKSWSLPHLGITFKVQLCIAELRKLKQV